MTDKIEIQLSKTKILLLLIGGTVFVVLGILFIMNPEQFKNPIFPNAESIIISGIAGVVFFLTFPYVYRKKTI